MPALVTLTTNFGEREPSVAAVKGALHAHCPGVQIEDLSHELPRGEITESALFVAGALPFFPAGTVHLVDVDPGPTPIAVSIAEQLVVCPDNGVLTMLADHAAVGEVVAIALAEGLANRPAPLLYGREVFAPAAAALAAGARLDSLGAAHPGLTRLDLPTPEQRDGHALRGEIIHIDRFGNLVTNIHRTALTDARVSNVVVQGFAVGPVRRNFEDVEMKKPLAILGASGYLEIAYRGDRADTRLKARKGLAVKVELA